MGQYQRRALYSCRIIFGSTQTSLIGLFHVKITGTFHISIRDDGSGMIADHRTGIVSGQLPHREDTAFTLLKKKRAYKCLIQIRIYDGHQRMISTESIPQREDGINRLVHTSLMRFQIHTQIAAISICKQVRLHACMIKCSIEHSALISIFSFDVYL